MARFRGERRRYVNIRRVAQEEPDGCLVACIAMVSGRSYAEIRAMCAASYNQGIHDVIADNVLDELGFAVRRRYRHNSRLKIDRTEWPCAPFAPVHIFTADVPAGHHAAVLLSDGVVLDPWTTARTVLTHPDYLKIDSIAGYWAV